MTAEAVAVVTLTRGPVAESVTQRSAVIMLDSDTSVARSSPQLRFARRTLARRSCFRFAAWHHPPWEAWTSPVGRRASAT